MQTLAQRLARVRSLAEQFVARRSEFGTRAFWRKTGRVVVRAAQTALVPEVAVQAQLKIMARRPWNLHLEPTNACNADCVFCAYQYQQRRRLVMPMELFRKALGDYVAIGGGDLLLQVVVGDPLLDPTFVEKVREARREPSIAAIKTISNGIGLDRIGAEDFVKSGLTHILISTAGFDKDSYEAVYRVKKYDKMRENVLALLEANRRHGNPIEVTIGFRTNRTITEVMADPDFRDIAKFEPRIDFTYSFDDWLGAIDYEVAPEGFKMRIAPTQHEPCLWLYDGPIVFANGDVGLCGCRDIEANSDLIVGNIMEASLIDIWRSERVKSLRSGFCGPGKPNICAKCKMYRDLNMYRTVEGMQRTYLTRKRLHSAPPGSPYHP